MNSGWDIVGLGKWWLDVIANNKYFAIYKNGNIINWGNDKDEVIQSVNQYVAKRHRRKIEVRELTAEERMEQKNKAKAEIENCSKRGVK